jgi:hypothetical protein
MVCLQNIINLSRLLIFANDTSVHGTERSGYTGTNDSSNQHVLLAVLLTRCSTVQFLCMESRLQSSDKCI